MEDVQIILVSLLCTYFAFWIGRRLDFFNLPFRNDLKVVPLLTKDLLIAISLFFLGQFTTIVFIEIVSILSGWDGGSQPLKPLREGLLGLFVGGGLLTSFTLLLPKARQLTIWGNRGALPLKELSIGIVSWFFVYPLIILVAKMLEIGLNVLFSTPLHEQVAVLMLKETFNDPFLFQIMLLAVVVIIPFFEELLFRGLVQPWLIDKVGIIWGIFVTSFLFAFLHLSLSQGISNILIFISLFVFSLCLGWLRYMRGSLWASVGLHIAFNAFNSATIVWQEFA